LLALTYPADNGITKEYVNDLGKIIGSA